MSKYSFTALCRKQVLFLVVALISAARLNAQTDISIGTGTNGNSGTSYPTPLQDWYEGSRAQFLYTASELSAAGMVPGSISAIKFNVTDLNTFSGDIQQLTISIGVTTATDLSTNATNWEPVTATVFGPVDYTPALGDNTFTFNAPFFWDGTQNIVIEICNGLPANINDGQLHYTQNVTVPWTSGLSFNGSHTIAADNEGNMCGSTINGAFITTDPNSRPNITFSWTPATSCTGIPVAGTAVSTAVNVCLNEPFTLKTTGTTVASGLTYQWQKASSASGPWSDIGGVATRSYTTSQTATSYYRCIIKCTSTGGGSDTTTAVQVSTPAAVSGTYTIDKGGTGQFLSFNDAYNFIKCGINGAVIFNVKPGSGPYNEQLIMQPVPGASATQTVRFNGNGATITFLSTSSNERAVIKLNGADHIIFDSLVIDASAGTYGFGVQLINNADSNTISRCTVNTSTSSTSGNYAGIVINASATDATSTGNTLCDGNTFISNTINGGFYGMTMVGGSATLIANNKFVNNTVRDFYFYGIYASYTDNALIEGNTVSRPTRTLLTDFYGIYCTSGNRNARVSRNRITNPTGADNSNTSTLYGIYITDNDPPAGAPNIISNNLLYDFNGAGSIYALYSSGSNNVLYYHNTVSLDNISNSSSNEAKGFYQTGTASGIEFKNNIITITRGGGGENHGIFMSSAGTAYTSNYNDIYLPAGASNFIGYNGADRVTLANWQSASGQDGNSVSIIPQYSNQATGNYMPTNVQLGNLGRPLSPVAITTDITNTARSATTPDIGAYEFTMPACTNPPVPGTVVSSENPVCAGVSFSLSVTGGTAGENQTWQWQSSPDGTTWTDISGATHPVYSTTQTSSTWYRMAVTCGTTVYSAALLVNTTPTVYATLPFTESFENSWINGCDNHDIPNNHWTNKPATGDNAWRRNDDGASANWSSTNGAYNPAASHGVYSARFHSYDASSGTSGSFDLYVNCNTGVANKRLTFDFINTSGNDSLVVLISTNGGSSFTRIDSVRRSGVWRKKTINFASASATTIIRFRATSDFGTTDIGLDNIALFDLVDCSGTPQAGTTVSTANPVCQGTSFTLSASGAPILQGVTYQWQSSSDNITWTDINGATADQYTTTQTANTWYRVVVTCTLSAQSANAVPLLVAMAAPDYAPLPYTESFENTWANGCNTRDIPNNYWRNTPATGNNSWRRNDDGPSAQWTSTNGEYTPAASGGSYSARFHSYNASSNSKGRFDLYINAGAGAPSKQLTFSYINTSGSDSLSVYLSTDAGATFTRLDSVRTSTIWKTKTIFFTGASATSVIRFEASSDNGSTDIGLDDIRIIDWADCSGTPNAGTTVSSATNVCIEPFTLSVTGVTTGNGISYQWQSSADNLTWSAIPGATGLTLTTTQIGSTWYRLVTTCSISGTSANAAPVQVISPTPVSGNFDIDNSLPTGGINFNSFHDAYEFIRCGINGPVTFNVKTGNGAYNEQLIMGPVPGASALNTVTFKGNGVAVIGFAATVSTERAVIKLKGAKHIIFDSLVIDANAGTYGYGVQLMNDADSNVVRNCIINLSTTSTTQNFAGIVINGSNEGPVATGTVICDANTFANNTITGGYYGITLVATFNGGANGNNRIVNNTIKDFYQYGMYVGGSFNTLIEGNRFSRPARADVSDFTGIYFATQRNTGCTVSKNRIFNPFGAALASTAAFYGIHFSGSDAAQDAPNVVSNNLIHHINGNGPVYGIANTGSDYVSYFHNTISLDSATGTSTATTRGFYQTNTAGGLFFYNNIISITRGGTGLKHCIYLNTNLLASADNNDYYINTATGNGFTGYYTANRTSLGDWRTATAQETGSLSVTPAFTDPNNGDYTPGNAGMDNKALPTGIITDDINSVLRNAATPDIGAYEFTPPPCSMPVQGPVVISPDTICQYNPVHLSLEIGAFGSGQTFQWQSSPTPTGTFTSLGTAMLTPDTTIVADTTLYYRVAISCGTNTIFTDAVKLVVNPALPSGTYTINKGNPTDYIPGKPGGNFISFAAAKDAMSCGIGGAIVFNVVANSGPYNEQLILDSIPGTSAVNTITFNGNGNTIAFSPGSSNEKAVVKLRGVDHIVLDSLVIDASGGTYGYGVQLVSNADSNTLRRCAVITSATATGTDFAGIVINATETGATTTGNTLCDGNAFDGNTISGGYYGATLVGSTTATAYINNNSFTNNTIQDFYYSGLYAAGTINTLIEGNTFTRPARTSASTNVYGIYLTGAPSNRLHISKNRFTKIFAGDPASTSAFYGIYHNAVDASAGSEDTVSNNLFYELDGNGIIYTLYNTGSNNVVYYHNSIAIDNSASTTTAASAGFYQTTTATGIQFINNIINVSRGGTGNKHAIYLNTTGSEILSNHNDLYADGTNAYVGYYTANRAALSDWITASGKDSNSLGLNPLYTDPAGGDLRPQLAALDNKGIPVGIATDITNAVRNSTTPDIGAYEFAPQPCQNPPVAGTASVTPNSGVCLEAPIKLNVTGHSPLGNITFQWQSSPDGVNWDTISPVQYFPEYNTVTTTSTFFRAAVTCAGNTVFTAPVQVTLNTVLLQGTYTINPAGPATQPNFQSFQSAVDALLCGITGPVVFNVAPGTYNEQIRIPYIPNTSAVNTVTFQSANNIAASVNLSFDGTTTANYTLKLDSTKYFIFRNLTITGTNANFGRVVELAGAASRDSIVNCSIVAPAVTVGSTNAAGIYASQFKGSNIAIIGNTITNGSSGIYFAGTGTAANLTANHIIDSNTVSGAYQYGIYATFAKHIKLNRNTITLDGTVNALAYGLYAVDCDSSYEITKNKVNVSNTTTTVYGIAVNNCDSSLTARGKVTGNQVTAVTGNSGVLYGMHLSNSPGIDVLNNVIAINTSGASAYGLYHNNFSVANYYNNSVNNTAASATNNYAAYFQNSATTTIQIRNNIFSHKGGGKALFVNNTTQSYTSDYNMLYSSGSILAQRGTPAGTFATLAAWKAGTYWDINSIVYEPAFVNDSDLHPNLANPDVWAMHGRGIQIAGNNFDFNNEPRPVTLTAGVPDLGAYEFYPSALPTVLTAIPAAPAANQTQNFLYGTDTVMKITWKANAPASVETRRFSGVVPAGLQPGTDSMYFYTKVDIPGGGDYDYDMELFYIDPWQGSIPDQHTIGLGKTTASNAWMVGFSSRVDVLKRKISQQGVNYLDRFTGLVNPYAPPVLPDKDSSNRGRRFWVGYGHHQGFTNGGGQDMVLYLSADAQAANVQVKINGTNWVRNYLVPANTAIVSDVIPKTGADDARLIDEGLFNRGISITSDVPIVAYAHIYQGSNSGATMLMPVGVYGYEYVSLNSKQFYGSDCYSWFYAIADNDSTLVEITPTVATKGGRPAGVPFTVYLNKGEVYQVMGTTNGAAGTDLTGSRIRSIPNAGGKCYPIAVFSGSSRTAICYFSNGDNIIQQVFPYSAWGKRYATFASANSTSNTLYNSNIFRVMVKDTSTTVTLNGVILPKISMITPGNYYEFNTTQGDGPNGAVYIEADKPVLVGQYQVSTSANECAGVTASGNGDPELVYISPIEQGIDKVIFYNTDKSGISGNYINVVIPTGGMASLTIDGGNTFTDVFDHPYLPGYKCVRHNLGGTPGQHIIESDSAFTAFTYGLGSVESYGYNAGTLVRTLHGLGDIRNTLNLTGNAAEYTCEGAPFKFTAYLPFIPTSITWKFSQVPGLSPHADVTITNPTSTGTVVINGTTYYTFPVSQDYTFTNPGVYGVEIAYAHPDIESCDHTGRDIIYVQVVPAPQSDFTVDFSGCVNDVARFTGEDQTRNGINISNWEWLFHDGATGNGKTITYTYGTAGTYTEKLHTITADGCVGDTSREVVVNPLPTVTVASLAVCTGADTTLVVENPVAGATYTWYASATGGSPLGTGASFRVTNITAATDYYVQQTSAAGCSSAMTKVSVSISPALTPPVVAVDSVGTNLVRFRWNAIPGATGYQVSLDGGVTWITPSSGATGLTHTAAGLQPLQTVTIIVRAMGACENSMSQPVSEQVRPDGIFIPNSFTPNGDGLNDELRVYSYKIRDLQLAIFNQWGEKIFETRSQANGWDGTYKGKRQPSGVYMYVCRMVLDDGTVVNKKGAINLIR